MAKNLMICFAQLLVTNCLSVLDFYLSPHPLVLDPISAFLRPVSLLVWPIVLAHDKSIAYPYTDYTIALVDTVFLSIMTLLVLKDYKFLSGVCLLSFQLVCFAFERGGF